MASPSVEVRCTCGKVRGAVANASPDSVNRMVCYCDDCQAFLHQLGRAELLDAHGGSDVVQVAPAALTFTQGTEHIACLRLSPKGLYRWYASCCNTPLGNTLKPGIPFVGVLASSFAGHADSSFGPATGAVQGKFAVGGAPEGSTELQLGLIARALRKVLGWKLLGKTWPHPYFERSGEPRYPVRVLSREERARLRPLCGPTPTAQVAASA